MVIEGIVFGHPDLLDASSLGPLAPNIHSSVKSLGVYFHCLFKFDKQISFVVRSSFFQLRLIAKVKSYLPHKNLKQVIHAFISSRLDYCNSLYFSSEKLSIQRLQLIQNAAARLLTGKKKRDHITPVLLSLHWLPVQRRIEFKILLLTFKSLNGLAPPYLAELIQTYTPTRQLRSMNELLLNVPKSKQKTRGDRAFAVAAPIL